MNDRMPSPEFEEKIHAAVSVPEAEVKFVNRLRSRLVETAAQGKALWRMRESIPDAAKVEGPNSAKSLAPMLESSAASAD